MKTVTYPIIIPSLYRGGKHNSLEKCLRSLYGIYNPEKVIVILQKYPQEVVAKLEEEFNRAILVEKDCGSPMLAFNKVLDIGMSRRNLSKAFFFMEDDVSFLPKQTGTRYYTLSAMENVMKNNLDTKVGIVSALTKGLVFGKPLDMDKEDLSRLFRLGGNPCQLILFRKEAVDTRRFREDYKIKIDSDFTMQVCEAGYFPLMFINNYTYNHMVQRSKRTPEGFVPDIKSETGSTNVNENFLEDWQKENVVFCEEYGIKLSKSGKVLMTNKIKKMFSVDLNSLNFDPKKYMEIINE